MTRRIRLWIAAVLTAVFVTAWRLNPYQEDGSARRMETHRQLGLPPCSFIVMTGLPCPTCGMTTAFAWMMHGHPLSALIAQPLGAVLCLATIAGALLGAWMAATGRCVQVDWYRFSPGGLMFGLAVAFFLAWGAKIGYGLLTGTLPQRP